MGAGPADRTGQWKVTLYLAYPMNPDTRMTPVAILLAVGSLLGRLAKDINPLMAHLT